MQEQAVEAKPEVKQEIQPKEGETNQVSEQQAEPVDDTESRARKLGWLPKEELDSPDDFVDAKEFIARQPLYDTMRKLKKKANRLETTVNELKTHYQKVEQNAYQRAIESLKKEKLQALESGDHARVLEVDDELDRLRDTKPEPSRQNNPDPAFVRFTEQNPWYDTNSDMREFADFVGVRYAKANPDKSPEEVFDYAIKQTRKQYPDHFRNTRRSDPAAVESSRSTPTQSRRPSWSDLPEHYRAAGNKFVSQGVMTREQYIDDLIKIGEIKA